MIGYVVVTAVILALGLILSALIGERRSRVAPDAGRQTEREMVKRATLAGIVGVAALIALDIAEHAVLVWPESTAHQPEPDVVRDTVHRAIPDRHRRPGALGHQPEHVELEAGQLAEHRGHGARGPDDAGEAADETPGGERVDKRASSGDGAADQGRFLDYARALPALGVEATPTFLVAGTAVRADARAIAAAVSDAAGR